jgi:DNA-binding NtrC family response regulator
MKTKILLVDDHPAIRTTMFDVMVNEGFDVQVAECGEDAIRAYSNDTFQFVLMDMQMPDMKGVDAYRKMLEHNKIHAKFIFISAFSSPELENEAHELGCIAFLQKPIRVEQVIELIRSKSRKSVLVFIENTELLRNVMNQLKKEGISAETANAFDEALIKIRQINYNYIIIDEDSPSVEQEGFKNTIKVTKSESHIVNINEDEPPTLVISRIQTIDSSEYSI